MKIRENNMVNTDLVAKQKIIINWLENEHGQMH